MTKISDDDIRTNDPVLKEILSNIILLWNLGKVSFNEVSTVPDDTPDDVEIRAFHSGATYRIYIYFPSDGTWRYANLT